MDSSCSSVPANRQSLIIAGSVALVFSIISFILAIVAAINVTLMGISCLSILLVLASIFGISSCNRCMAIFTLIFSILAIILGIVAVVYTAIFSSAIHQAEACYSSDGHFYGTSSYYPDAFLCTVDYPGYDCSCVNDDHGCLMFNDVKNCDVIVNDFRSVVGANVAFTIFAIITVFALSIVSCVTLCCPPNSPASQQQQQQQQPKGPSPVIVVSLSPPQMNQPFAVSGTVVTNPVNTA